MKTFRTMIKTEILLAMRSMDAIFFGIFFPMGLAIVLGIIYGSKPAYAGADYTFVQQSFGAVISIGICATGLMGIPLSVSDYRHKKILKRYKVTPVSPGLLLFTQVVVQLIIAAVSALGVFLVMKLFFGYHMPGSFWGFVLAYLLVTLAIYGLGMMLASISPNMKTANLLCSIVYFPMIFLSGATIPYEVMPKVLQRVSDVMPLTQGIKILKGFSLDSAVGNHLISIVILSAIALVTIIVSIRYFKWE
jgi:ABC-2 type transport system permease protein